MAPKKLSNNKTSAEEVLLCLHARELIEEKTFRSSSQHERLSCWDADFLSVA